MRQHTYNKLINLIFSGPFSRFSYAYSHRAGHEVRKVITSCLILKPSSPTENRLLAALQPDEYQRLVSDLQPVTFSLGKVMYESGGHLDYIYFPTASVVSLLYMMEEGAVAEAGLAGNDGVARYFTAALN